MSIGTFACLIGNCGNVLPNIPAGNFESHVEEHHKIEINRDKKDKIKYAIIVK